MTRILPDYEGSSIVNLMSSIAAACGSGTEYKNLRLLKPETLKAKNIVLILIDGMGYEYVSSRKDSFFKNHVAGSITSAFPSTTAACIPMFATGVAAQQHGLTGWFMQMKELGLVSVPLPFGARFGAPLSSVDPRMLFDQKPFCEKIRRKSHVVIQKDFVNSAFQRIYYRKSTMHGFSNMDDFFRNIKKAVNAKGKKYVYAYWSEFDSLSHHHGVSSKRVASHYSRLEKKMKSLLKSISGTDTVVIVPADHGEIDTEKRKVIRAEEHPKLAECLSLPLCGEPRLAYCYVRPAKSRQFERYVRTKLKKACHLHKSETLMRKNYFGLGKPHPRLHERIGDYVLEMKENYIIIDSLVNEKRGFLIGNHGGTSSAEMLVPLIFFFA